MRVCAWWLPVGLHTRAPEETGGVKAPHNALETSVLNTDLGGDQRDLTGPRHPHNSFTKGLRAYVNPEPGSCCPCTRSRRPRRSRPSGPPEHGADVGHAPRQGDCKPQKSPMRPLCPPSLQGACCHLSRRARWAPVWSDWTREEGIQPSERDRERGNALPVHLQHHPVSQEEGDSSDGAAKRQG